jgi:hypothetical protein
MWGTEIGGRLVISTEARRFLQALERFNENAWWKRIWVFQEVVVAKEVTLCWGTRSIDWPIIAVAASRTYDFVGNLEPRFFSLKNSEFFVLSTFGKVIGDTVH